jgi:L-rhamnose isomerase
MGYVMSRKAEFGLPRLDLCLDMGHFHPTETIADKISSTLLFVPGLLIHFSRGVRWDSDHITSFSDEVRAVCQEIYRNKLQSRVNFALDFFDASVNRIAAWTIGSRNMRKAVLEALLEPTHLLREAESEGRNTARLALMEEYKTLPLSAVWDKLCLEAGVPAGTDWLACIGEYEEKELAKRN